MSTLAQRIREARGALSQADLAKRVGISQVQISRLESGEDKETVHLIKIALETGYSPFWLANAKGPKLMSVVEATFHKLSDAEQRATLAYIQTLRGMPGP